MWPAKYQRTAIVEAVKAGGLDATECTFDHHDEAEARVTHVPSGAYFLILNDGGRYNVTAVDIDGLPWQVEYFSWHRVPERIERWAKDVKREFDAPDPWAELQRQREVLTGARYEDVENTPFTPDEQAEIAEKLRQIRDYVEKTYSLTETAKIALEARLDYIEAAVARLGRRDWRLMVCGVMLTLTAEDLLPRDTVLYIFTMALHGLDYLLGGGGGPPQLPR